MKTILLVLTAFVLCGCELGPPATPWERYGGGQCTDVYIAYEVDDPGPYCPHRRHFPIDQYITVPNEGRPARVVACACVL